MEEDYRVKSNSLAISGVDPQTKMLASGQGLLPTRREFLTGVLAASGFALSGLPEPAASQDPAAAGSAPDPFKIGEIESKYGKLRGVLTILNEKRMMPADGGAPGEELMLRYFQGKDADGNIVWPPANATGPLPGPTLRAQVGDRVEITFLNHVDVDEFERSGLDRVERGEGGCDALIHGTSHEVVYPDQAGDSAPNCFHGSSTVNVHYHGTHVTPDGLGDNVLLQLRPNPEVTEESVREDFEAIFAAGPPARWQDLPEHWRARQENLLKEYDRTAVWKGEQGKLPPEFQLWPAAEKMVDNGLWPQYQIGAYPYCFELTEYAEDEQGRPIRYQMGQCPGTHWYHAHKHGSTTINLLNGMAGVFVIEGDYDRALEKFHPRLKQTEKVLIVQDFSERPNLAKGNLEVGAFAAPSLRVNGRLNPTIVMQPGEIQLWRMVNASVRAVTTFLGFAQVDGTAPEIRQTAQDGVQFSYTNYMEQPLLAAPPTGEPRPNTFAPANRIDVLVKAPSEPGSFEFKLKDTTRPPSLPPITLLTLTVEGDPLSMNFPMQEDDCPRFPNFLKDIDESEIRIKRTLHFGWERGRANPTTPAPPPAPQFTIDDQQFSGRRYDQTMVLGDAEEWKLTNSTARIAHPFHIHINPFQVVEIYDPNAPDPFYSPPQNFVWQDVVAIPPAKVDGTGKLLLDQTGKALDPGYVRIRHRFVDFPGSFVLHCHMLAHEDRGMMQLIRVIPSGGEAALVPHH